MVQNNLFRKEALERVASPERLDQLVQVVSPRRWLTLAALGSLVAAGLTWSIVGRIPITVTGRGVLIYPSKVVAVQASSAGRILAVNVQAGDTVKKGQVLATIDQTELQNQLQLARTKLTQLRSQDQTANSAQLQRSGVDQAAVAQQRQALQKSLETVEALTPVLREKGLESIQRDRQALQDRLNTLQNSLPTYRKRWLDRQAAQRQGALSRDNVLQAEQEYRNAEAQVSEVESQLKQLDVKEADAQRQYQQNENQANELRSQIKALESRTATQAEQDLNSGTNRKKEIQETERLIAQLELQLNRSSQIVSEYNGQMTEVTAKAGQQLEPGVGIGSIAAQEPSAQLVNVAFLPVQDGKQIASGAKVQITPTTVKREEFGGIEGTVKTVGSYPISQQAAASLVGNPDILPGIFGRDPQLAVFADPQPDPSTISGYRWSSSKGAPLKLTPGTTTTVRITIEDRAPISFVLPILKSWTGLN